MGHSKNAYLLLMHTVLSITVVIVALFSEYSTNVWTTSSLRFGKYSIKALGDIRVTPSTQRNLGTLVPVGATKPRIEAIEHVTDKEAAIKSGASEQKFVYSLKIPAGLYQTWSNWSKCDPIDCVQRRRRECADGSWKPSDVNRSGARRCPSRYYEVTRKCKNKKTCLTYGMLENCGIQSANENTDSNPTGDKRTTLNSWPWLVRLITTDSEGNEYYWCSGTLVSLEWIVIAAHCFTDNGWVVVSGRLSTPEKTIGTSLYAYLGHHRQRVDHGTDEKYLIKTVFINIYYEAFESDKGNDMALLQLAKPAELRKELNYACIARQPIQFEHGTQCYAVGWGQMPSSIESNTKINSHDISHGPCNTADIDVDNQLLSTFNYSEPVELQEVIMPIMSASKCLEYYGLHQTESQFCADWRLRDSCERDCRSGLYCKVPYTNKWLLAGVRNYGTETECRPGTGIYTSAITGNDWIWSRIGKSP